MSSVEQLEQQKTKMKAAIERRDIALRLAGNRDFRKLILEYFCVEECARYARESGDPVLPPENRADALAMAQAAGHLKRFLSIVIQMGNKCEDDMIEMDEMLAEQRAIDVDVVEDGASE